ncbi:MAG: adenylosuccinate lyase [Bacteroidota bacterium]|jgi:adenylosuccinate lyase
MMEKHWLAISPIDGRYAAKCEALSGYFSEYAFMKYRIRVEVEYLLRLLPLLEGKEADERMKQSLQKIYMEFDEKGMQAIKVIEKTTNHDVKAVEYYIKDCLKSLQIQVHTEWVHFGLTSQDINNTCVPLMLKEYNENVFIPKLEYLLHTIRFQAQDWRNIPMLARTHGQPASPTSLGKEWMVFHERLQVQLHTLKGLSFKAKFGGATGNFNAHYAAFPAINWPLFADGFIQSFGLKRSVFTTQIEHYDELAAYFDCLKRINVICLDFCKDVWQYISMEYFRQKLKKGEVGSSAMPHKINPIDFENAEGNLGLSNALLMHFGEKLPISRLQRDLSDSTVLRNMGVPLAHQFISIENIITGLNKLIVNKEAIEADLQSNPMVIAEAIQTILRSKGIEGAYEMLKSITRTGESVSLKEIREFITGISGLDEATRKKLLELDPLTYTGTFPEF